MTVEARVFQLLRKLFDDCVYYQSIRKPFMAQLKNTNLWSSFETLCKVLDVDTCWFYEYMTGIKCDCNPDTEKGFQKIFDMIKG